MGSIPITRFDTEYHINIVIYIYIARVAQLVEHDLAKVGVAGSSPVSRFSYFIGLHCTKAMGGERRKNIVNRYSFLFLEIIYIDL